MYFLGFNFASSLSPLGGHAWGNIGLAEHRIRVIWKVCARFPGSVLPAVTPIRCIRGFTFFCLPFLCFSSFNLPQHRSKNPSLLVFYATQHRSKTCPSCVLRHPTSLKILPFLCFRSSQKSADQKTQEGQAKSGHQNSSKNRRFSIENPSLLVF